MKIIIAFTLVVSLGLAATGAEDSPLWLRYPAISPDGRTLLFEFKGDIWSVPAEGGNAIPLTLSESYEFAPVWSHDGKSVAFASDRYGNFDVFVMGRYWRGDGVERHLFLTDGPGGRPKWTGAAASARWASRQAASSKGQGDGSNRRQN